MNSLLDALHQLAREKDIPYERLVEQFQKALAAGYKKNRSSLQEVSVELDDSSPVGFRIYVEKEAVAQVTDPQSQISLEEARAHGDRCVHQLPRVTFLEQLRGRQHARVPGRQTQARARHDQLISLFLLRRGSCQVRPPGHSVFAGVDAAFCLAILRALPQ